MITYNPHLKIFSSSLINDDRFFSGFSTKELGDARKIDTLIRFFGHQNIQFKKLVILEQIHSTNIEVVKDFNDLDRVQNIENTDGVITDQEGCILVVRNADCVPIIFVDKIKNLIGISHQGWRGSLNRMASKMVDTFLSLGSKVENIICSIGPAIGSCCYDIDDERYYNFLTEYENSSPQIFNRKQGRWHLNLSLLNYLQLIKAGIKKNRIEFFPFCTKCDSKRFFSRRGSRSNNFEEMFNFVLHSALN